MIRINFATGRRDRGRRATRVLLCAAVIIARPAWAAQGCPIAPPPMALPKASAESTLSADQASLSNVIAQAKGHVRLTRNGQALEAPFVRYNRESSRAQARHGVKYYRPGLYLNAANGSVNINHKTGVFNRAHYEMLANGARGKAEKVVALGNGQFALTDANYSTCAGHTKAWLLSAAHIKLNRNTGRGVAHNATLRFYGIPLLYTPYINFPIDNRRHTGVLAPTFGKSGSSGFELAVPYYFNIAPNYDATLVPRVLTRRGLQLGGQFRYLSAHQRGELDGQYLPQDQQYGADRYLLHFDHVGRLNPYLGIAADYNLVSDDNYFDDLSNDLTHTSTAQLERAAQLTAAATGIRFTLLAQAFQTLHPTNNGRAFSTVFDNNPYRRLPQARLALLSPTAPFQAGLDAEFTNFQRDDSLDAERIDARPRLLWGTDHGGWYVNSQAAYRVTRYELRNRDRAGAASAGGLQSIRASADDSVDRAIPSFKLDSGLRFSRGLRHGWIQTLEPRAQYLYVGYKNQSNIPVFDSGVPDLHFERLFADNRFTGIDRIGDANQVTLGLTSRFIEPADGRTVVKLDLGRATSFRHLRVNVPNSGETGYNAHGSDYVGGITVSPSDRIAAQTTLEYDAAHNRVDRAIVTASYAADAGYRLDLGYRRYRNFRPLRDTTNRDADRINFVPGKYETLQQTVLGFRAPVTANLDVLARWNYSLERSQNVETLAGFEYRPSCCWAGRVAVRHYVADFDGGQDTAVLFQFVLNGLGRFGDTISSFVRKNVFSNNATAQYGRSFDTIGFP